MKKEKKKMWRRRKWKKQSVPYLQQQWLQEWWQVVIDVFQNKNEISDALQAAIDTYEEKNLNVKINLETVGGSDYASSLKAKMLGNDPVEIFTLGGPDDIASYQEYLESLTVRVQRMRLTVRQ